MEKIPLPGSERPEPPGTRVDKPSPDERISVCIVLRPRSSKGERFPQRATHQRLSAEEFAALHGADPQDVAKIEAFAKEANLSVSGVFPAKRTIDLSGTAADFGKAFQVDLAIYESEERKFLGHAGHTYVPLELVSLIQGVFGLDNRPVLRSSSPGPSSSPTLLHLSDITAAYNFPTGVDGTGETIAIITFDSGYDDSDLGVFFALQGTPAPAHRDVSIDGAANNHQPKGEVGQDIQIAGGVAPGAQIVIYFCKQTIPSLTKAIQTAVGDAPHVISMSLGVTEVFFSSISEAEERTIDQLFQDAAALSITVLASTGDQGGTDGSILGTPHVEFPASSPNVTACGGCVLPVSGDTTKQIVWNENATTAATGGGVSGVFSTPTYQSNLFVTPVGSGTALPLLGRGTPDVAGHAAGIHTQQFGGDVDFVGTSAVTPLWAGLIALINQAKGLRLGFFNDILYGRLATHGALGDIKSGDNGVFQAVSGWDACTGWGSPNGGLIAFLIGPPTIDSVSPLAGPVGGGIQVTIKGSRFFGVSLVSFGGTDTKNFHVDSDTQITVLLPENTGDGTVTIVVTTDSGTGGGSPNSDFSYVFPVPVIQSINPSSGRVAGGDSIFINGVGFTGAISVGFDNAGVVPTSVTDTQITINTPPANGSGPAQVTVTTPGGQSAPSPFTYVFPQPEVQSVNPAAGPLAGGTPVTIVGAGFTGATLVDFGGALQPIPFTVVDDGHITMFSQPGNGAGPIGVTVTTLGGTSVPSGDEFTYF